MNTTSREEELIHLMALSQLKGIGPIVAKKLIAHCGGSREVFDEKEKHLKNIPGVGGVTAATVKRSKEAFVKAESEMDFIYREGIDAVTYLDENYPRRLKYCEDGPLILFSRGNVDMNKGRMLAIVGTRKPSHDGNSICEEIVSGLRAYNVSIVRKSLRASLTP